MFAARCGLPFATNLRLVLVNASPTATGIQGTQGPTQRVAQVRGQGIMINSGCSLPLNPENPTLVEALKKIAMEQGGDVDVNEDLER